LTYQLLRDAVPVAACAASPCLLDLAVGEEITVRLKATSDLAGVEDVVSAAAGPFRQYPDAAPQLAAVEAASAGGAAAAGAGSISLIWPRPAAVEGHQASVQYWSSAGPAAASDNFWDGLAAGAYSFHAKYCLVSSGGVPWLAPGPADLCSTAASATVAVTTKPAAPVGCAVARRSETEVEVAGCRIPDVGGLAAALRYPAFGGAAATAATADAFTVEATAAEGQIELWASNELGASPRLRLAYGAHAGPLPGAQTRPTVQLRPGLLASPLRALAAGKPPAAAGSG
jgi:hypothetical protein